MFPWKMRKSLAVHNVANAAGLECRRKKKIMVDTAFYRELNSSCPYWVPVEDWKGETVYLKAHIMDYIVRLLANESPL